MRSPSRDSRTQPVPSMSAWADGSASTANTASGAASIVVDAVTRSVSIPVRRLAAPELIAARDGCASAAGAPLGPSTGSLVYSVNGPLTLASASAVTAIQVSPTV